MKCRHCNSELEFSMVDLGSSPPSNSYLNDRSLHAPELWYPLNVLVCQNCWLVQTEDFAESHHLFDAEYAYFSSYSTSWLAHAKDYTEKVQKKFNLNKNSLAIEVACNDGYLLQYFKTLGVPCLGIEPTASTAIASRAKGIETIEDFFGKRLAKKLYDDGIKADLMVANNVLAHVPDINDFVSGFAMLLNEEGVATFEFPHVMKLVDYNQFDIIYHEHFSYLSLTAVDRIFTSNGLAVFDVEELPTHGGSLRVYAQRLDAGKRERENSVFRLLSQEKSKGIESLDYYQNFQKSADKVKNDFTGFLIEKKMEGKLVAAYGAAAKGNTLMNYAGTRPDLINFVVDRSPSKQGKYMPGSRIPIFDEVSITRAKPDYVVILPWNLKDEITQQLGYVRDWGGKFVTAVPQLDVF